MSGSPQNLLYKRVEFSTSAGSFRASVFPRRHFTHPVQRHVWFPSEPVVEQESCSRPDDALPCSSTPWYAVHYHASRILSGSLPCSTSDCANREEIYATVRYGRDGQNVRSDACAPNLPFPLGLTAEAHGLSGRSWSHLEVSEARWARRASST
eukprot:3455760-Pyramimonas_sp.AAC.1